MAKKILIIDDDKAFLSRLKEMLLAPDYDVMAFEESVKALDHAKRNRPDLIVIDIEEEMLIEAQLGAIANYSPRMRETPVILIAGKINRDELNAAMKICNVIRHFERPVDPVELVSEVRSALSVPAIAGA